MTDAHRARPTIVKIDDDRGRRSGGCIRPAGVACRAGRGAPVGDRARHAGRRGRARFEPARRGRRHRRAGRPSRGGPRDGRDRRRPLAGGRWRDERGLSPPRPVGGSRRPRVRLRDPGHGGRRRADERRRVRLGLGRDPPARARRLGGRERLADAERARPVVPALRARARSGRGARRVPPFASAHRRDQEATSRTSSRGARRRSRRTSAPSARSSRTHPASSAPAACSRAAD